MSVQEIQAAIDGFKAERDTIMSAAGRTNEWKQEQSADARRRYLRAAQSAAEGQWGVIEGGALQGGQLWRILDRRRDALRNARDRADTLDVAKVRLAMDRLPTVLWRLSTLADVSSWYDDRATSYEARALQMRGDLLRQRFGSTAQVYALVGKLEAAYQSDMLTPDVQKAEARLSEHFDAMEAAYKTTREAADTFAGSSLFGVIGDLGGIVAGVQYTSPDNWQKTPSAVVMPPEVEAALSAVLEQ